MNLGSAGGNISRQTWIIIMPQPIYIADLPSYTVNMVRSSKLKSALQGLSEFIINT